MKSANKPNVQNKLEKKIVVLSKWVRAGIPKRWRGNVRFSIRWVAEWSDSELGVDAIGSPNTISKNGPYRDLIIEVQALLLSLQKTSRAYQTKSEENVLLKAEVKYLKRENRKLSDQWHSERKKGTESEDTVAFVTSTLTRAEEEIGNLRNQLVQVIPLRPLPTPSSSAV